MMRYIHHSCRTVIGWQKALQRRSCFFREIWKAWNGFFSLLLFFLLLCLVRYSTFIYVFSFISPDFYSPFSSRMDWLLKSLTLLSPHSVISFSSLSLFFFSWFG
ncbi:hypothetical protein LI328DRAFT_35879 [Trichoderma asperelloides]|nr:hypothetical protein LI328DRAFT_35879 [Trichoderma asperelloides]